MPNGCTGLMIVKVTLEEIYVPLQSPRRKSTFQKDHYDPPYRTLFQHPGRRCVVETLTTFYETVWSGAIREGRWFSRRLTNTVSIILARVYKRNRTIQPTSYMGFI